jgi:acetyltransferase-like isoleucine patch superfamily enzyme
MRYFFARLRGMLFTVACRLRRPNITVGPGLCIFRKLRVRGSGRIVIGNNCRFDWIDGDRRQYNCIDTRDRNSQVTIGNDCNFYSVRITARFSITIGNHAHVEESAIVDTDFHSLDRSRENPPSNETAEKCRIEIGNHVAIAARSIVAKGVRIGDNVIIGPGSIVKRSIPSGKLAFGNPAAVFDDEV